MIKKYKIFIIFIFILFFSSSLKAENQVIQGTVEENIIFSLTECIAKALENNPEIKAGVSDTNIFYSKIGQAKAGYFPRVSLSLGYSRINPLVRSSAYGESDKFYDIYNFSAISLDQLIYDFGKTPTLIKISKLN